MTPPSFQAAALGLALCLSIPSCDDGAQPAPKEKGAGSSDVHPADEQSTETPAVMALSQSIKERGHIAFNSWQGELKASDSDAILHFYDQASLVLEDRAYGVAYYEGCYDIQADGTVLVHLVSGMPTVPYLENEWPELALELEAEDLMLQRKDGHTHWLPKSNPDSSDSEMDGFWPFRAKLTKGWNYPKLKTYGKKVGEDHYLHLAWFHGSATEGNQVIERLMASLEEAGIPAITESQGGVISVYVAEKQESKALHMLESDPKVRSARIKGLTGYQAKYFQRYLRHPGDPEPLPDGFPECLLSKEL